MLRRSTPILFKSSLNKCQVFKSGSSGHVTCRSFLNYSSSRFLVKKYGINGRLFGKIITPRSIWNNILSCYRESISNFTPIGRLKDKCIVTVTKENVVVNNVSCILKKTVTKPRHASLSKTIKFDENEISMSLYGSSVKGTNKGINEKINNSYRNSLKSCQNNGDAKLSKASSSSLAFGRTDQNNRGQNCVYLSNLASSVSISNYQLNETLSLDESLPRSSSQALKSVNGINDNISYINDPNNVSTFYDDYEYRGWEKDSEENTLETSNASDNTLILNPNNSNNRTILYFEAESVHAFEPSLVSNLNLVIEHIKGVCQLKINKTARIIFVNFEELPLLSTNISITDDLSQKLQFNGPDSNFILKQENSISLENPGNKAWIPISNSTAKCEEVFFHGTEEKNNCYVAGRESESDMHITKLPIKKDTLIDETVTPDRSISHIINSIDKSTLIIQKDLYITDKIIKKINESKNENSKDKLKTKGFGELSNEDPVIYLGVSSMDSTGQISLILVDIENIPEKKSYKCQEELKEVHSSHETDDYTIESFTINEENILSFSTSGNFGKQTTTIDIIKKAAALIEKEKYHRKKLEDDKINRDTGKNSLRKENCGAQKVKEINGIPFINNNDKCSSDNGENLHLDNTLSLDASEYIVANPFERQPIKSSKEPEQELSHQKTGGHKDPVGFSPNGNISEPSSAMAIIRNAAAISENEKYSADLKEVTRTTHEHSLRNESETAEKETLLPSEDAKCSPDDSKYFRPDSLHSMSMVVGNPLLLVSLAEKFNHPEEQLSCEGGSSSFGHLLNATGEDSVDFPNNNSTLGVIQKACSTIGTKESQLKETANVKKDSTKSLVNKNEVAKHTKGTPLALHNNNCSKTVKYPPRTYNLLYLITQRNKKPKKATFLQKSTRSQQSLDVKPETKTTDIDIPKGKTICLQGTTKKSETNKQISEFKDNLSKTTMQKLLNGKPESRNDQSIIQVDVSKGGKICIPDTLRKNVPNKQTSEFNHNTSRTNLQQTNDFKPDNKTNEVVTPKGGNICIKETPKINLPNKQISEFKDNISQNTIQQSLDLNPAPAEDICSSEIKICVDKSVKCLMSCDKVKGGGNTGERGKSSEKKSTKNSTKEEKSSINHFTETKVIATKKNNMTDITVSEKNTFVDSRLPIPFSTELLYQIFGRSSSLSKEGEKIDNLKSLLASSITSNESKKNVLNKLTQNLTPNKIDTSAAVNIKQDSLKPDSSKYPEFVHKESMGDRNDISDQEAMAAFKKLFTSKKRIRKIYRQPERGNIKTPQNKSNVKSILKTYPKYKRISSKMELQGESKMMTPLKSETRLQTKRNVNKSFNDPPIKSTESKTDLKPRKKSRKGILEHKSLSKRDKKILKAIMKGSPQKNVNKKSRRSRSSEAEIPKSRNKEKLTDNKLTKNDKDNNVVSTNKISIVSKAHSPKRENKKVTVKHSGSKHADSKASSEKKQPLNSSSVPETNKNEMKELASTVQSTKSESSTKNRNLPTLKQPSTVAEERNVEVQLYTTKTPKKSSKLVKPAVFPKNEEQESSSSINIKISHSKPDESVKLVGQKPSDRNFLKSSDNLNGTSSQKIKHTDKPKSRTEKLKTSKNKDPINKKKVMEAKQDTIKKSTSIVQLSPKNNLVDVKNNAHMNQTKVTIIESEKHPNPDGTDLQEKFKKSLLETIKMKIALKNPINFRVNKVPKHETNNTVKTLSKKNDLTKSGSQRITTDLNTLKGNTPHNKQTQQKKMSSAKNQGVRKTENSHYKIKGSKKLNVKGTTSKTIKTPNIKSKPFQPNIITPTNKNPKNNKNYANFKKVDNTLKNSTTAPKHDMSIKDTKFSETSQPQLTQDLHGKKQQILPSGKPKQDSYNMFPQQELFSEKEKQKDKLIVLEKDDPQIPSTSRESVNKITRKDETENEVKKPPFPKLLVDFDKMTKEIKPDFDIKSCLNCLIPLEKIEEFPLMNSTKTTDFHRPYAVLKVCPSKDPALINELKLIPPVTKILNITLPLKSRDALRSWRRSVEKELGEDGFKSFYKGQMTKGVQFHNLIQDHLLWGSRGPTPTSPIFQSISHIMEYIKDLAVVNSHVVHKPLAYRGVVDCVATYKKKPVVIEWKRLDTKERLNKKTLETVYLQMSAYIGAVNYDTNYKFQVKEGLLVIAYDDGSKADVFDLKEKDCDKYWKMWLARLQKYHNFIQDRKNKQ